MYVIDISYSRGEHHKSLSGTCNCMFDKCHEFIFDTLSSHYLNGIKAPACELMPFRDKSSQNSNTQPYIYTSIFYTVCMSFCIHIFIYLSVCFFKYVCTNIFTIVFAYVCLSLCMCLFVCLCVLFVYVS